MTPSADAALPRRGRQRSHVDGHVNGRLPAAPEGARWRSNEGTAVGRAAAEVGARAQPDAPPSRRGWIG